MKTLKGLKNNISSFENNKLSNLKSIKGGLGDTEKSRVDTERSADVTDVDVTMDNGKKRTLVLTWG